MRSGARAQGFSICAVETRHFDRIQTGLDTPRIGINACLRCVWKNFPKGTHLRTSEKIFSKKLLKFVGNVRWFEQQLSVSAAVRCHLSPNYYMTAPCVSGINVR